MSRQSLFVSTVEASTGWDCYRDIYTGNDERYCVYSYTASPQRYDNKCIYEFINFILHVVAPTGDNLISKMRKLKKDLQAAGFTYPSEMPAGDEEGQDIILECSIWDAVPYEEESDG